MTTIRYQLTKEEMRRVLLKHRRFPYRLVLFRAVFGLAGLTLLFFCRQFPGQQANLLVPMGIFIVVYSVIMLVWLPVYRRRVVDNTLQNDPLHTAPVELSFRESGLIVSVPDRKAELAWSCFKRLTQDEQYFYLHYADLKSVEPLPKRAFDADCLAAFLRYSQSLQQA